MGVSRMSPKCVSSCASLLTAGPKCCSISRASVGAEANPACAMQRGREYRILGQCGDDDGRFDGLVDGCARHAPAFEPGCMRVD